MKAIIDNHQIEFQFIDKIRYIELSDYIVLSDYIELSDYIGLYRIIEFYRINRFSPHFFLHYRYYRMTKKNPIEGFIYLTVDTWWLWKHFTEPVTSWWYGAELQIG